MLFVLCLASADEIISPIVNALSKTPTANTARIIFTDLSNLISCLTVFMFPPLFFHKSYTQFLRESVPEPCCFMPITSPFRLKFLKFFQIRYLESQNVLSVPDCLNQRLHEPYRDSLFKLPDFDSRNGVNSKTK
uniref:Uncharacterized protein n=1 Tax=uncultured marine microorganism HF4000_097M14 TaxID=455520 RepID=B3T1W8_9ZZZZ|nr:hypothetical protein ALOHA_HF4000097M14ctg1g21 [uncultured marine microorganism HF4000_097M14]